MGIKRLLKWMLLLAVLAAILAVVVRNLDESALSGEEIEELAEEIEDIAAPA